jgi:hypothetical protein
MTARSATAAGLYLVAVNTVLIKGRCPWFQLGPPTKHVCDVGVVCLSVDGDGLAAAGVRETAHTLAKVMLAG